MNLKNAANDYYGMIETIMNLMNNVNLDLIKRSYFYRLYFKTTIYLFLFFYRLGLRFNYKPLISFSISIITNAIYFFKKIEPRYCSFFKEKPILKDIKYSFFNLDDYNPKYSKNGYDRDRVEKWKKNSTRNLDDALKLVSYEKNKNRKVRDVLDVWSNIHNKNFIPYVLKEIVGIRSFSEVGEMISYIEFYEPNIKILIISVILNIEMDRIDDILSKILNKMDEHHKQIRFKNMRMKIMGPYRSLLNGEAKGSLDALIESKNRIDFEKFKKSLINNDREIVKKFHIFILCIILLNKYSVLYIGSIKDKIDPTIKSISKNYIKNSIKFIEQQLIDDTIYNDFLDKDNNQKTINNLKNTIDKIDISSVKIGSFTENLIWDIFAQFTS